MISDDWKWFMMIENDLPPTAYPLSPTTLSVSWEAHSQARMEAWTAHSASATRRRVVLSPLAQIWILQATAQRHTTQPLTHMRASIGGNILHALRMALVLQLLLLEEFWWFSGSRAWEPPKYKAYLIDPSKRPQTVVNIRGSTEVDVLFFSEQLVR